MVILGIGGLLTDAACAVLRDGQLIAAAEEKKFARQPRPGGLPEQSIAFCLKQSGMDELRVDYVALVRPIAASPDSQLHLRLRERFPNSHVVAVDHHRAHAASAYLVSPFDSATVLTLDRAGDLRCGALWRAESTTLRLDQEAYYPDSLGHLYGRVTELLGFVPRADEHKVQWLSASGDDRFVSLFEQIVENGVGHWARIDRRWFDDDRIGSGGFDARFYEAIGLEDGADIPESLKPHIAAGVQRAIEGAVIRMAGSGDNLCVSGGMFLNVMLVAALERCGNWKHVFVQPAAGNAGTSIGAALEVWHGACKQTQRVRMPHLFLGPSYNSEEIKQVIENCKLRFRYLLTTDELVRTAVAQLAEQKIVAWMQGAMEFGPRALGNRSILASPLDPYSTENLNIFIKHREPFRKFAASIPAELASHYFDVGENARFLATLGRIRPQYRKVFQAATLGEDMIRVHTVTEQDNPSYWRLLHAAGEATGLPFLFNTSFNLFSDPLVCTPRDAVRSFYSSGIDAMFVGNFLIEK